MPRIERRPTLVTSLQGLAGRLTQAERNIGRVETQLLTDLSVTSIGTTAKLIAEFDFIMLNKGLVEVYASFTGQMSGAGRSVAVTAPLDGAVTTGARVLNFTSTSSQTLFTQHGTSDGATTLGGFVMRHWNVSAGKHTLRFYATGSGAGVNESLSSGQIAYRVIS